MWQVKKYYPEITGSLICLTLGLLSGMGTASNLGWYATLNKPFFNPPNWLFGPVWTILYLMIGAAAGILWKEKNKNQGLIFLFGAQFFCNAIWTPLFFYFHRIDLALIDIGLLWFLTIVFLMNARREKTVLILCWPYLLWITYAMVLNFSLYLLN